MAISYTPVDIRGEAIEPILEEVLFANKTIADGYVTFNDNIKAGSIFTNAARGTCVDIDALSAALESKHIGGAAIDVFPKEPKANDEEFLSPLRKFDNVILTPHIGGSTLEAQANETPDGVGDVSDICPSVYNPDQKDVDHDGISDLCDNCPSVYQLLE